MAEPLQTVIRYEVPVIDGCPCFGRIQAFTVKQGVTSTLEHVFVNDDGNPADISEFVNTESVSGSASIGGLGSVVLKVKEVIANEHSPNRNPIWTIPADVISAAEGIVRAKLPKTLVERSGIYESCWGVVDSDNSPVAVNNTLVSVERSLFTVSDLNARRALGPPTLKELRMSYMDSSPNENLLIDRIEFTADQVIDAIRLPIEYWNEQPPPLRPLMNTRTFPFRYNWLRAIHGHLLETAAHNFRRNTLPYSAGGVTIDDLNKERQYLAAAQMRLTEYKEWVQLKKCEINIASFHGSMGSTYNRGWR